MAFDRTRTLRGALAGAAAAAVWAAQQPLDKRVFGVDYDDAELLGRLVRLRGPATPPGAASRMHLVNGARVRRRVRQRRPEPARPARRCAARPPGSPSTSRTWPGTAVVDRLTRPRLPAAVGRPARVRAGHLAPPAVRRRARRARAAAEPAGDGARARRRRGGRHQRARLAGAPGRHRPLRVLVTGASGVRRAPPRRRLPSRGRRGRRTASRADGVDLLDAGGGARRGRRRAARRRLPPRRARARGRVVGRPGGFLRDNLALALNVLEAVRARGPGRGRGRRRLAARSTGRRRRCRSTRARRCARRTRTRSRRPRPTCWRASTPTPTACG